jgi:peroxiredoxin/ribosomal protein L40E
MQPKPNIAFCPNCRKPKDPKEVTCSQCGTRACPNGHTMASRICSLCGWEDRSWRPQTRSYSPAAPVQKPQEVPDAKESVCPRCKVRTVFTSGRCLNCGYISETDRYNGKQQKATGSVSQAGSTFQPEMQHDVVQQQFPGVHDARREYVCPRCGAKADPRAGGCQNCGYIGSLEYEIPKQQIPGSVPLAQSAASTGQQSFGGQRFIHARDMSPGRVCPFCGGDVPSDSKFCQRCGKPSGSGRQHEQFILATDRAMRGEPMTMGQMAPSMDTAYAAESAQGTMGMFMPEAGGISISEREFPRERGKGKRAKEKGYLKERKGFPKGLLAAIFIVAAALVAMIMVIFSQVTSTPTSTTPTPTVDKTPPEISEVAISSAAGSSALIEWTTDEKATSQVMLCDPSGTCTWTEPDATLVKYHTVNVNDIKLDVNYHVTVKSIDASGNENSFETEHIFATEAPPDNIPVGYEVGNRAPDFTLEDLGGNNVVLSSFKGQKIVMVNFWAVTCGSCVAELPAIEEVYQARSGTVEVLAVNAGETKTAVQSFIDGTSYNFTVLLDSEGVARAAFNVPNWPRTFFIDKTGIIKNIKIGQFANKAEIDTILNSIQ